MAFVCEQSPLPPSCPKILTVSNGRLNSGGDGARGHPAGAETRRAATERLYVLLRVNVHASPVIEPRNTRTRGNAGSLLALTCTLRRFTHALFASTNRRRGYGHNAMCTQCNTALKVNWRHVFTRHLARQPAEAHPTRGLPWRSPPP